MNRSAVPLPASIKSGPPEGRPPSAFTSSYEPAAQESTQFLQTRGGEQLYLVHHAAAGEVRGGVVIAQPFAHERPEGYSTCVRWSRLLARSGVESVRFDYRGTGESTGEISRLGMDDLREDLTAAYEFLRSRSPGMRIILHGIRLGAIPVSEVFDGGAGDGMLLWSAPDSARDHLMEALRFMIATQMVHRPGAPKVTRDQLAAALENGQQVNVGGFFWGPLLWSTSQDRRLRVPPDDPRGPWLRVAFDTRGQSTCTRQGNEARVSASRFWDESDYFFPPADTLLDLSLGWVQEALSGIAR